MTLSQRYWMIHFINLVDNGEVFKTAIEKIPTFRGMKQSSREVAYLVRSIMNSQDGCIKSSLELRLVIAIFVSNAC